MPVSLANAQSQIGNLMLLRWRASASDVYARLARFLTQAGITPSRLPLFMSMGLSLIIAWQLAVIGRIVMHRNDLIVVTDVVPVTLSTANPVVNVQAIVTAHLFGEFVSDEQQVAPALLADNSLVLTGTIVTGGDSGYAFIGQSVQSAHLYRTGEILPGNYRLVSIHQRHVVMEHEGARVVVAMPNALGTFGGMQNAAALASSIGTNDYSELTDMSAQANPQQEEAELEALRQSMRVAPMPLIERPVYRDSDE